MAKLIRNRRAETDNWLLLKSAPQASNAGAPGAGKDRQPAPLPDVPPSGDVIVPLALWQGEREALLARAKSGKGNVGVWLDVTDDPQALAGDVDKLQLIAVNFPKFADGRCHSTARLLRERYGYQGELRAVGEVGFDLLLGMYRCGIDSFALRDSEDVEEALSAFDELPVAYQANAREPQPLFRRRAA